MTHSNHAIPPSNTPRDRTSRLAPFLDGAPDRRRWHANVAQERFGPDTARNPKAKPTHSDGQTPGGPGPRSRSPLFTWAIARGMTPGTLLEGLGRCSAVFYLLPRLPNQPCNLDGPAGRRTNLSVIKQLDLVCHNRSGKRQLRQAGELLDRSLGGLGKSLVGRSKWNRASAFR